MLNLPKKQAQQEKSTHPALSLQKRQAQLAEEALSAQMPTEPAQKAGSAGKKHPSCPEPAKKAGSTGGGGTIEHETSF
ncbi:hypothetical protein BC351_08580 [Paenibacillus ferrarius]|uniref:Uncharacterized protein n=1 Tax=Paenibacillus ferrarius TaxID=1469647 RepID=A0A1V4HA06_9BACL|nr:hypothetical protein BC351_08580 [Paenibacillus ferrarius]